jgi:hypothetical protein
MADQPRAGLVLIVVGTSLRAEEADRPLAYYLKEQVEEALAANGEAAGRLSAVVVADLRWLHDEALQDFPTISLGGPGVNFLSQRWVEELPLSLAVDNQFYIQMDPELKEAKVSLWGMDNASTQVAVSAFVQRFLPRFLERGLALLDETPEPDDEEEDDEDDDED